MDLYTGTIGSSFRLTEPLALAALSLVGLGTLSRLARIIHEPSSADWCWAVLGNGNTVIQLLG